MRGFLRIVITASLTGIKKYAIQTSTVEKESKLLAIVIGTRLHGQSGSRILKSIIIQLHRI